MKAAVYIMILLVALVMVPILSNVVMAAEFDYEACLESCENTRISPWLPGMERRSAYSHYYEKCVAKCETQRAERLKRKRD